MDVAKFKTLMIIMLFILTGCREYYGVWYLDNIRTRNVNDNFNISSDKWINVGPKRVVIDNNKLDVYMANGTRCSLEYDDIDVEYSDKYKELIEYTNADRTVEVYSDDCSNRSENMALFISDDEVLVYYKQGLFLYSR